MLDCGGGIATSDREVTHDPRMTVRKIDFPPSKGYSTNLFRHCLKPTTAGIEASSLGLDVLYVELSIYRAINQVSDGLSLGLTELWITKFLEECSDANLWCRGDLQV